MQNPTLKRSPTGNPQQHVVGFRVAIGLLLVVTSVVAARAGQPAARIAQRVDQLLAEETTGEVVASTDDATFLRRVSLDLVGRPPSPEETTEFALDPSEDKRAAAIERLLDDERFGENWARYWRDVMLSRRNDERALNSHASALSYLTDEFNAGTPWNELAHSFVTASGSLSKNGATALIASQWGETEDTASEISRVLTGVQISCAQCHDHPTDRWSREQFHELAAFFPRLRIRRNRNAEGKRRDFEIVSFDRQPKRKPKNAPAKRLLVEHRMPDLDDPSAQGTLMRPAFFVTGQTLETGENDLDRRRQLADWITSPDNPWFSKAFVNRIWAELVGEGFYEPIDDLGPDRDCSAPKTMDVLAAQFEANDYDVKWLYRTIMLTDVYGRAARPPRNSTQEPFQAVCVQRLRSDQVFDTLTAFLGIDEAAGNAPKRKGGPAARGARNPRVQFAQTFGFDPSEPRSDLSGTIPQALFLMNSPVIGKYLNASNRQTALAELLATNDDDELVIMELYLRTLAREPSDEERATCLGYVEELGDRKQAFEDVAWALINSTEFLHRN